MKASVYPWRNKGLVYLAIPKAACSSIKYALRVARGLPLPEPVWKIHEMKWPEEMRFEKVREWTESDIYNTLFTVVRNPADRLLSCYMSKFHPHRIHDLHGDHPQIRTGWTFREFVEFVMTTNDETCNEHLASQVHLLSDSQGLICYPQIRYPLPYLRFEELDKQWKWINSAELSRVRLPHLNQNIEHDRHIPPRLRKMIAERYAADYVQFGYSAH